MASDEKINAFVQNICCSLWKINKTFRFDDIAYRIGTFSQESSNPFLSGTLAALWLYEDVFITNVSNDFNKYRKSKKEFCNYIRRMCNCENWLGKPSIFERIFASLSFVLVCTNSIDNISNNMKRYAPTCWEVYFMEYIEEFYRKGGWEELRRLASSYKNVLQFLRTIDENPSLEFLTRTSKSVENYLFFSANRKHKVVSNFVKSLKIEHGNECKTSATLWIKFRVKNYKEQSFDNACTQPPKNPSEVTCLMRVLRCLCNPSELEERKFDSNLVLTLTQKSNEWAISSSEQNQETSSIQKEQLVKGKSEHSGKQSIQSESMERVSSSSMNNCSLGETAIENEHNDQLSGIFSFTEGENRRIGKISSRGVKDTNVSSVKYPSIKINDNNWANQKEGETKDEYINRLERFILSSNKDISTEELHGKSKIKLKKKNSGIPNKIMKPEKLLDKL